MDLLLYIAAVLCFLLEVFSGTTATANFIAWGLAFLSGGHIFSGTPWASPWTRKGQ